MHKLAKILKNSDHAIVSIFDLFSIGIGPSSSHTVGPMRAANSFVKELQSDGKLDSVVRLKIALYGSLAMTGEGHGTPKAVMLGLEGEYPESIQIESIRHRLLRILSENRLMVNNQQVVHFDANTDLMMKKGKCLPFHSNGMRFMALDALGNLLSVKEYFSIGGGFIISPDITEKEPPSFTTPPFLFRNAKELLKLCGEHGLSIAEIIYKNEKEWRSEASIDQYLLLLWKTMEECIQAGLSQQPGNILPGGLGVKRRAAEIYQRAIEMDSKESLLSAYAIAVNEENASGGRVVTCPTNGASGIIPAILKYHLERPTIKDLRTYFLTSAAVGMLFKGGASISAAEVGCQGEIGVACSMAAAGLTALKGGTPRQVENAAEIAMEHCLGLTCDPIGGLVQIPCIERNAIGAAKAITSSNLALHGDGSHHVSLDTVIRTMFETGRDMGEKYKETSQGGLALNHPFC